MSKILYIYSYNQYSNAAKELSHYLLVKRIKHEDSKFKGNVDKTVVNWGASILPIEVLQCTVLNKAEHVREVINKLTFFAKLEGMGLTPEFTTSVDKAKKWLDDERQAVCRTILTGSGGRGIVIADTEEGLVEADLYVKYIPKKDEYRVHIFDNEIIDVQKKMMCEGWDDPDWQVRNVANGFIYGRIGIAPPSCVLEVAMETFRKFDLDFGAVDVIYTENINRAYALEINTAPGLEGQTVISYAEELARYL